MSDEDFMRLALQEASAALRDGNMPVGAIVTLEGTLIAKGRKTREDFHLGHAETVALHQALSGRHYCREDNIVVYTTLEPCAMCYGMMLHCPIRKVVYALEDTYGGATSFDLSQSYRHTTKPLEIVGGVLREESRALFKEFFCTTENVFWKNPDNPLVRTVMA